MKHSKYWSSILVVAAGLSVLVLSLLVGMPSAQAVDVSLPSGPPRYKITDLGTLGGNASYAYAINDSGQVAGDALNSSGVYHAFLWQDDVMTDLGTLGGSRGSEARGINEAGQVVGYSFIKDSLGIAEHAFLWQDGVMTDLGTLGGTDSYAFDINRSGVVVGGSYIGSHNHAFLWGNGTMIDLNNTIPPDHLVEIVSAQAITDNSPTKIVGTAFFDGETTPGYVHAFLWSQASITDLGTLGGWSSVAKDINASGKVVGYSLTSDDWLHAFLWNDGAMTDLGTLGGDVSEALAINDAGQVVGYSYNSSHTDYLAFLWQNGTMIDINTLIPSNSGWHLSYANDINEAGQIVGWGIVGGARRSYLLTPLLSVAPTQEWHVMPTQPWVPVTPSP